MRKTLIVAAAVLATLFALPATSVPASAADQAAGSLVSDAPAKFTPHVLDGRSYSIAQVGGTMVLGGTFSQTQEQGAAAQLARANLFAFDATTGKISTTFVPNPNGVVNSVLSAGDGQTVYVGGSFSSIGGVATKNLARVRVSDGAVVSTFNGGSPAGQVTDLRLSGGRLWVAGAFTHIAGKAQPGLATLNPTTGKLDTYMSLKIAGIHNSGFTTVRRIDVDATGKRLVAIGNFDTVDGVKYHQFFALDTAGAAATVAFGTSFYEDGCASAFDSYMRDLDVDPSGTFVVVSTTGAYGGAGRACDSTARFELSATGSSVTPSWVNNTGGDTTYAVEIADGVVYTGGHARWQNNPFAGDTPGPGAVSRPGLAALDPQNGLPLDWNPTRTRGVGVFDLLSTSQGLWVLSDTDRIGKGYEYHARLALMPRSGGKAIASIKDAAVPNDVYSYGAVGVASDPRVLYRVNAAGGELPSATGVSWAADSNESPSPYHNADMNRAGWSPVGSVDSTVPAGTPSSLFDSELWDGGGGEEMHWGFPVQKGVPIQVRLYFANRCGCTSQAGQRVFDVAVDGQTKLDHFDIVQAVGDNTGTMRSFDLTSDGMVDIDLSHVVENPLVNGIEIVRTDLAGQSVPSLSRRSITADGTTGAALTRDDGGVGGSDVRGAFMVNGNLYTALADGRFVRRSYDGSTYGPSTPVDAQDALTPLTDWANEIKQSTGMFYQSGRIYFTLAGSSRLYYRYFAAQSDVVGAQRFEAGGNVDGIDQSKVAGMFATGAHLYWATADGDLHRIGFRSGVLTAGSAEVVSGPATGVAWGAKAMFLFQDTDGTPAEQAPTADFTSTCDSLKCSFDASASTAPGSSVSEYTWDFGDGSTGTSSTPDHAYAKTGSYAVALTVRAAKGRTTTTTHHVQVVRTNAAPKAGFSSSCDQLACSFDAGASSDDTGVASYDWDFGDGDSAKGSTVSHTFAGAGDHTVTLVVTDDDGATDVLTKQVTTAAAPAATVDYVSSATTNGNRINHAVKVPADVRAGDTLLLYMTSNSGSAITAPSGWTSVKEVDIDGLKARVWTRTATAADAGTTVTATTAVYGKSDTSVVAYRSSSDKLTVADAASTSSTASTTSLRTAAVKAAVDRSRLVSYWGTKGSADLSWTEPADQAKRVDSTGTSTGRVSALLADARVSAGTTNPLLATTSSTVARAATFSVVLSPVVAGAGTTQTPVDTTPPAPVTPVITHLGSASTNGNRVTHQVTVPTSVTVGDRLVLFMSLSTASATVSPSAPSGWEQVRATEANGLRGFVWTKVASAADAGATVSVTTSEYLKSDLTVGAYQASTGTPSISASAGAVGSTTSNPSTPTVGATGSSSWLVSYWGAKGSSDLAWTPPAGQEKRAESTGTLSGRISALLTDSGAAVAEGERGGLVASASSTASRTSTFSVVLSAS